LIYYPRRTKKLLSPWRVCSRQRLKREHQIDPLKESDCNQDNQDNDADYLVDNEKEYYKAGEKQEY